MKLKLKELREEKKISQSKISEITGNKQAACPKWELQQRDIPNEVLCKLADYFEVSTDYLLGRTEERKPYPPVKNK